MGNLRMSRVGRGREGGREEKIQRKLISSLLPLFLSRLIYVYILTHSRTAIHDMLEALNAETGWDVPIHVDAASGGFIGR